jgi:hypothetical protein
VNDNTNVWLLQFAFKFAVAVATLGHECFLAAGTSPIVACMLNNVDFQLHGLSVIVAHALHA